MKGALIQDSLYVFQFSDNIYYLYAILMTYMQYLYAIYILKH